MMTRGGTTTKKLSQKSDDQVLNPTLSHIIKGIQIKPDEINNLNICNQQ